MSEIKAASESEVLDAVGTARSARTPLEIVSAGSKRKLGRATLASETVLDVSRMRDIVSYEPAELVLTVRAGTPISEIEAVLSERGQRLGFDPPDWGPLLGAAAGIGTIGGAISAATSGPARVRFGAVRDHLLGFRAVNGFGEAFKAGGRVVKNVTGFDIPKLVCGAFGTLCVLTEVTLRVFPKPSRTLTLSLQGASPERAFALLRQVWASPLEATGLACTANSVFIRLEGEKEPLAEKVAMLRTLCGELVEVDGGESIFRAIADGEMFRDSQQDLWRIALPPAQTANVIAQSGAQLWLGDCAGGILWLASDTHAKLHETVRAAGGHSLLVRATDATRADAEVFEREDPLRAQLTRAVKAAFDPLGLFNPGRMWDGV